MFSPYPTPREGAPVIRGGGRSARRPPANLRAGDAPLFAHEFEREIPPTRLLELRGVAATPEGMLFKGSAILPESFSSPVIMRHFLSRRRSVLKFFATNRALRRRRRIEGPRLWVTDDWSHGYFHWLADALPRLYAAREAARETVLLLPRGYERLEFVTSSLKLFDLRGVEYVGADEVCVCERLLMPTHTAPSGNYNEPLMRELRGFVLAACGVGAEAPADARLFVSRGRAPKRKLTNETEVARAVGEFGFRVVHFEEHPFAEQLRLAASARHLVSNHGAGLTNILFMPPGGSVLELRREGERERNWFYILASAAGLNYYYQPCTPADGDAHSGDLTADTAALRANLRLMLGRDA
jgi:capsular polysaccharide biosynthesis protein